MKEKKIKKVRTFWYISPEVKRLAEHLKKSYGLSSTSELVEKAILNLNNKKDEILF